MILLQMCYYPSSPFRRVATMWAVLWGHMTLFLVSCQVWPSPKVSRTASVVTVDFSLRGSHRVDSHGGTFHAM